MLPEGSAEMHVSCLLLLAEYFMGLQSQPSDAPDMVLHGGDGHPATVQPHVFDPLPKATHAGIPSRLNRCANA